MRSLGELVVALAPMSDEEKELVRMVQGLIEELERHAQCEDNKCPHCRERAERIVKEIQVVKEIIII